MTALTLQRIDTNFQGQYCYTHARGTVTPGGFAIITTQPLRLTGCDVFYGMEMLTSHDRGATWSPIRKSHTLVRRDLGDGITQTFSDATPMYHSKTGKILLLGHDVLYRNDEIMEPPRPRHTLWSVFNPEQDDWEPFQEIKMPEPEKYFSCGNGCGQSVELENGELLIPVSNKCK